MEEKSSMTVASVPPPLPPKTRTPLHSSSNYQHQHSTTVQSGTVVAPSASSGVSFVDVFHDSNNSSSRGENHVVKILINPDGNEKKTSSSYGTSTISSMNNNNSDSRVSHSADKQSEVIYEVAPCIRISLNSDSEMIQKAMEKPQELSGSYFYYGSYNFGVMSSGQVSPSDTLDSGTCSDLDGTPTPTTKKNGVSVTLIGSRAPSSSSGADSDDNESNLSCDSLNNSGKNSPINPPIIANITSSSKSTFLPQMLLQDIRQRNNKLITSFTPQIDEKSYEERKQQQEQENEKKQENNNIVIDPDMFYKFHLNEHNDAGKDSVVMDKVVENETFAGYRDILGDGASTIRSAKGTVRGVKNRVRAGIATFLQINDNLGKNYKEKEAGKVVVYTTTMGVLRDTYQACSKVKQILRTLLVKYEERDVFMSTEYQAEVKERMHCDYILVPQVFVDGQHIGDAETVERLNESGELRRILKPFKSSDVCTTCQVCGGFRLLPCQICKGSKKSVHRNHFTAEFVALKCMNCDEVGLVRCSACS